MKGTVLSAGILAWDKHKDWEFRTVVEETDLWITGHNTKHYLIYLCRNNVMKDEQFFSFFLLFWKYRHLKLDRIRSVDSQWSTVWRWQTWDHCVGILLEDACRIYLKIHIVHIYFSSLFWKSRNVKLDYLAEKTLLVS